MARRLLLVLGILLGVVVILGGTVNLLAEPADAEPPADPALPIALPSGETLPLRDVLERSEQRRRALEVPEIPQPGAPAPTTARQERDLDPWFKLQADEHGRLFPVYDPEDVYGLARLKLQDLTRRGEGDPHEVLALLRSVPVDHPAYDSAQRLAAWDILTKAMDRPLAAVTYVNRAFARRPFEPENWKRLYTVYARSLGVPIDD